MANLFFADATKGYCGGNWRNVELIHFELIKLLLKQCKSKNIGNTER